ncbi:Flagellar motor switch protein FliN (modular protein) [uncultured Desulfobacterium sp.]|uniref:Flagellar motor switch protein FliN (Modular protein) n=1 Tax=uncultured Desulfobacterium sp. TaxID=201089 RepID=A0A445MZI9_9BACT|nr:Flagellar motor switch protein FliN (modular protein) [uncultured Desulfobacterium sp.]
MVDIKKFDIATTVTDSLIDVFDMMLSMGLQLSDDQSQTISKDERIVGSVSVAGMVMGCINIEVSKKFSHIMTSALLGITPEEVEGGDDVKDVIREICNIVGGNLKSAFCDTGLICELSPPSFTTGDDFKIEALNTVRHERYVFNYNEHIVIVEVGIRVSEVEEGADAHQQKIEYRPVNIGQVEEFDIRTPLVDQITEVFDMMLSMQIVSSEENLKSSIDADRLVGAISFVGPLMGNFSIHVSRKFSHQMTASMLGIELEEVEGGDDVKDVISELCSIVGGNLKSKFCDAGMRCELSSPSMTTGTNFKIEAKDMVRYDSFSFFCGGEPIVVDLVLKVDDQIIADDQLTESKADESGNLQTDIDSLLAVEAVSEPQPSSGDKWASTTDDGARATAGGCTLTEAEKLAFILDIPLEVVVELGRNKMQINELYNLGPGSVVEFKNLAGEPLDILVNGTLIAKGQVMVQGEKYGIKIVDILSRMERIRSMI